MVLPQVFLIYLHTVYTIPINTSIFYFVWNWSEV